MFTFEYLFFSYLGYDYVSTKIGGKNQRLKIYF